MKVEERSGARERAVLTAMVVSDGVLARVAPRWQEPGPFASPWPNLVGGWCVQYHRDHGKAPGKVLRRLYEDWAETNGDDDRASLVEDFLRSLSDEYEQAREEVNVELALDQAGKLFGRVRRDRLREQIERADESGQPDKAEAAIASYSKVELGRGAGVDLFTDREAVEAVFRSSDDNVLVTYPGALGELYGKSFSRGKFVAWYGREKVGKSYFLLDLAYRLVCARRRVAYFEVGDMTAEDIGLRFMVRVSRTPEEPGLVRYPMGVTAGDPPQVEYSERVYERGIDFATAWAACEKFMRGKVRSKRTYFRHSVHPNSTINVKGIEAILDSWELDGYQADCAIIDYSDILAAPAGRFDNGRDPINTTWKQLRALSQSRHILVATASQADAASYDARVLTMKNFSDDKRKVGHVTALFGINRTAQEEEAGVYRINRIAGRKGRGNVYRCVTVASCLELANPCVRSAW